MKFYYVETDNRKTYHDIIVLSKVSCLIDYFYLLYKENHGQLIHGTNGRHDLYIVEDNNVIEFEKNLIKNNIKFKRLNIDEIDYNNVMHEIFKDKELLNERVEFRKNNFKIIIRSNEDTNHSRPHVHVELTDGSSASISIDENCTILNCSGKAKDKDYDEAIKCIEKNIQALRKDWNEFSKSIYKFICVNNEYLCKK